jgi:tRNA(fMet)-specific endonuclease VapC
MPGKILLDTNIVIALFAGEDLVRNRLAQTEEVFLPSTVLGELYYGARKSGHPAANLARIDEFAAATAVLACDATTARYYGQIKDHLRSKGCPIPENDVLIAAIAQQYGLPLATRDEHFEAVDGLVVENW